MLHITFINDHAKLSSEIMLHITLISDHATYKSDKFARPWPRACQILDLPIFERFKSISDICFLFLAQTIVSCLDYVHARDAVREPRAMGIGTCFSQRGDIFANNFLKPSKCDFEQQSAENVLQKCPKGWADFVAHASWGTFETLNRFLFKKVNLARPKK